MKWEKQELKELDEMLNALGSLKSMAQEKLKNAQDRLTQITNEIPEYVEIYKKMKGE